MTGSDDESPAVVGWRLGRVEEEISQVRDLLSKLVDKLDDKFVPRELYEAEQRSHEERHKDLGTVVAELSGDVARMSKNYVDKATARWVVGVLITLIVGLGAILPPVFWH